MRPFNGGGMGEKIFCSLWLAGLLLLLFFIACAPHGEALESENRAYTAFSLASPDGYFTDRLPMRESLLRLNRDITLALGKNEFAGAFLGQGGYIFSKESTSAETLVKNLNALQDFADTLDIPVHTAVVGAKTDVLYTCLPPLYEDARQELWEVLRESGLQAIDLLPTLWRHGGEGKHIYYRGDHHLTTLGSYYCYREIAEVLEVTPYTAQDFSVGVVRSDFSGSDARKMLCETNDRIALFRYANDGEYVVENLDSGEQRRGLYDYDKLYSADPYGVFPIADCGYARITLTSENRQKLLLLCDSYGDSLVPFLARHFDLDSVDPRYYGGSVKALTEENGYAAVLVYFGMDTLAGREVLYKIRF